MSAIGQERFWNWFLMQTPYNIVNEMNLRADLRILWCNAGESNRFCTWSYREIE